MIHGYGFLEVGFRSNITVRFMVYIYILYIYISVVNEGCKQIMAVHDL